MNTFPWVCVTLCDSYSKSPFLCGHIPWQQYASMGYVFIGFRTHSSFMRTLDFSFLFNFLQIKIFHFYKVCFHFQCISFPCSENINGISRADTDLPDYYTSKRLWSSRHSIIMNQNSHPEKEQLFTALNY